MSRRALLHDLRRSGVNEIDMALQASGDGVGQRANGLRASIRMGKLGEVGRKEGVGLADIELDLQPVSRRRQRSGRQAVLLQPSVDSIDAVRTGSDKLLNLWRQWLAKPTRTS